MTAACWACPLVARMAEKWDGHSETSLAVMRVAMKAGNLVAPTEFLWAARMVVQWADSTEAMSVDLSVER
jgi:hypothetical protein